MPAARHISFSFAKLPAVIATIGISLCIVSLMYFVAARPSISGMCRSINMISYWSASSLSIACFPVSTNCSVACFCSRMCLSTRWFRRLSSAISILIPFSTSYLYKLTGSLSFFSTYAQVNKNMHDRKSNRKIKDRRIVSHWVGVVQHGDDKK